MNAIKTLAFLGLCCMFSATTYADVAANFDTDANWTAGSGGLGSYQTDHLYSENGLEFTGGEALRNTTSVTDGVAGALGTYSWRLRNNNSVNWTATYATVSQDEITGFGFDVRRWDGTPSPDFNVTYSFTGAAGPFAGAGTINNAFLNNSSDWSNFNFTFTGPETVTDGDFVVRITSGPTTERIMIDNFTVFTSVPEPTTASVIGLLGLGFLRRRRA